MEWAAHNTVFILTTLAILAACGAQNAGARDDNSGFGFVILPVEQTSTSPPVVVKSKAPGTGRSQTTAEVEQTTEPYSIFTFWDTTFEEESTAENDLARTTRPTPSTSLTSTTRWTTSKMKTKTSPPGVTATTEVFVMKNTEMKFIRVSPQSTATSTLQAGTLHVKKYNGSVDMTTDLADTTEFDYITTESGNESLIPVVLPAVTLGVGLSEDHRSLVLAWKTIFPYYHYLMSPSKFWAKYWYWILIVLILLVLFFFIPGFCCQLHWKTLEKRWKNLRLCSRKREKDIEKGVNGNDRDPIENEAPDSGRASSAVLSAASSDAVSEPCYDHVAPEPDDRKRQSQHSQAESGIHLQKEDDTLQTADPKSNVVPGTPVLLDTVQVTCLSQSSSNIDPSFQFPEPVSSNIELTSEVPIHRASALSQSDNGLDIGNETIIKSNPVTDTKRRSDRHITSLPPLRPPKPNHMIPRVVGHHVAPERRPKRSKKRPRSGSPKKEHRGRKPKPRNSENSKTIKQPSESRKGARGRPPRGEREAKKKNHLHDKKKIQSSTQSLMRAAQSLEDLLDAITKLTKEYPIPDVSGNVKSEDMAKKPRKRTRSLSKRSREDRKSKRRNRSLDLSRPIRDDDEKVVSRTKKHRTQDWAKEQKRIGVAKSKKKSRQDERRKQQGKTKKTEKEKKEKQMGDKEKKETTDNLSSKIPTLMKQELTPEDRTKQERRRMRLERDLKKLQKFHNSKVGKEDESKPKSEKTEAKPKKE